MKAIFVVITFILAIELQPISPQDLASKIEISDKINSQGYDDSQKIASAANGVVELSQFKAWTSTKHEDSISSITTSYPNESDDVLEITAPSTHVHFAFKLNSNLDDIAYIGVALLNLDTIKHVVLTPTKRASGNYQLKLKYTHSTFSSRVPGNGRYQIKLLISDPQLPTYIDWNVCQANINLARLPGAVRLASDLIHMPNPSITYQHRETPARSRSCFLSITFSFLMIAPLLCLSFAWPRLHMNIAIDSKPANILFHSLLLCCILTLTSYWAGTINLLQLIRPMLVIVFSLLVSYRMLSKQRSQVESISQASFKTKLD